MISKNKFINTLKPIVNSFNYYTGFCNYVIIDNFEYIIPLLKSIKSYH